MFRRRASALGFGVLFALLVAEVGLRFVGIGSPPRFRYEPSLGLARWPNMCWTQRDEGRANVCINADGFRDATHRIAKSSDVVRIAVLGDSYTEAIQVEEGRRYTSLLQETLNSRGGLRGQSVEVLNFGVSGYGTCQELMLLENTVLRYRPDIVLLQFMTGNDVLDNTRALSGDPMRPYFCVAEGRLQGCGPSQSVRDRVERLLTRGAIQLLRMSRVCQVAARAKTVMQEAGYRQRLARIASGGHEDAAQEVGLSSLPYQVAPEREVEQGWVVTCAVIDSMQSLCRSSGARFGVILAGASIEVHPSHAVREAYCRLNGIDGFDNPRRQISSRTRSAELSLLPLNSLMADEALASEEFFHGFAALGMGRGHWNEDGHAFAAGRVADWLLLLSQTGRM
jgi:lysophospholipase L1-like esterase